MFELDPVKYASYRWTEHLSFDITDFEDLSAMDDYAGGQGREEEAQRYVTGLLSFVVWRMLPL